jgi:hypothetical protein
MKPWGAKMYRILSALVLACALPALGGCVTLGADPLLAAMRAPPTPAGCNPLEANGDLPEQPGVDPNDGGLCVSILHTIGTARGIRNGALELDRSQAALGGTQIAAGVGTAALAIQEASPHRIAMATLAGGTALALRSGLKPQERRNVLRGGLRALSCTAERGAVFIGSAERATALRRTTAAIAGRALDLRALLTADARRRYPTEATALREAIVALETANATARANIAPMLGAATQVSDTRRLIERNMERQLDALAVDHAAILAAIAKLAPESADESHTPAGATEEEEELLERNPAGTGADKLESARDIAAELTRFVAMHRGPGQTEYAAIAQCATEL